MKLQLKDKIYVLKANTTPLSFMLSSRNTGRYPLLHFDEEKGINRPLRYARNQKTPFEDEQDNNAILEPVVFEDGYLTVPKTNPVLQWFLSLQMAESIARVLMGSRADKLSSAELKRDVRLYARNNPVEFLEMLDDPMLQLQDLAQKALSKGLVTLRNNKRDIYFGLKDNKKKMMTIPFGEEPVSALAAYLQTDEGIEVMTMLEKKLK